MLCSSRANIFYPQYIAVMRAAATKVAKSVVPRVKPPPAYVTRRVLRQRGPAIPNGIGNTPGFGSNIMTGFRNHLRNRQLGRIILGKEQPEHLYVQKKLRKQFTHELLPHMRINNKAKRPSDRINLYKSLALPPPSYIISALQASPVQSTSQSVRSPSPPPPPKKPKKKVKGQSTQSVVVMFSPVSLSRRPKRRRTKHNKGTSAPLF